MTILIIEFDELCAEAKNTAAVADAEAFPMSSLVAEVMYLTTMNRLTLKGKIGK